MFFGFGEHRFRLAVETDVPVCQHCPSGTCCPSFFSVAGGWEFCVHRPGWHTFHKTVVLRSADWCVCDRVVVTLEHNLGCGGIGPFSSGCSEGPSSRLWNHAAVSEVGGGCDVYVGDSLSVVGGAWGSESTVQCLWLFLHFPSGRAGQCTAHQTVTNATGFLQIEPRRMGALGSLCVHTAGGWVRHEP